MASSFIYREQQRVCSVYDYNISKRMLYCLSERFAFEDACLSITINILIVLLVIRCKTKKEKSPKIQNQNVVTKDSPAVL